uniref:Uncharacterized protein n=1 Tax=Arundo donax TaxID=35708 RepID=A0A0A8ZKE6_ARUDO
MWGLAIARR